MTTTNSQAGLAGLASISMIVAILSVLSGLGFGVIETLTRLRSGRRERLVVGSGQPKKSYTGTSDASVPTPQFDPLAMASASSDPRNLYSAQNVPAVEHLDRDLYMLEEAFWRESAPDTGPRRVHYLPDEQDRVERYVGAGRRNRELEYVGHQVRRSPGAHRRSSNEAKFGITGGHLGRIWRRTADGGGRRAMASGIANRA